MQLKVGGVYKARNGEREEIVGNDGDPTYPFDGESGRSYMPNGREYKYRETDRDLIAEWQDAPTDEPEVGKWIGWNGGECPVHPETVVDKLTKGRYDYKDRAGALDWSTGGCYQIITLYVEPPKPREFWLAPFPEGLQVVDKDPGYFRAIHVREVLPDDE